MKKLVLLGLPCVILLAGCFESNHGGGQAYYENTSSGGYATFSDAGSSGYSKTDYSSTYSASSRSGAPFGNYPVNEHATVKTG